MLILISELILTWIHLSFATIGDNTLYQQLELAKELERRSVFATFDPYHNDTCVINVWFNLMFVLDLDERRQMLTTSGWLDLWWEDDRFGWNTSMYGGIDSAVVSHSKVWKPDVVIRNGVNNFNVLGGVDQSIKVFSSGNIEWSPANIYQTICEVDVSAFPFDSQTCQLNFTSWMYYDEQIRLVPFDQGVITRHYKANSEWELSHIYWDETVYNYSDGVQIGFTVTFKLDRHSTFHVLKLLVPTVLLSLLNAFVFIVPVESGEKVSISVTTMLSLTVFLSYIGDVTPNNSENIPVIALFITLHLSLGALSIIFNIITLNYHFHWKPKESLKKVKEGNNLILHSTGDAFYDVSQEIDRCVSIMPNPVDNGHVQNLNDMDENPNIKIPNWTNMCRNLDRVFFVTFIITSISVTALSVFFMVRY